jgi:hypothetical protein
MIARLLASVPACRLEAHMARINPQRRRGRPFGEEPVFLADCVRIDAIPLLARSRGSRYADSEASRLDSSAQWLLRWTADGREQRRMVTLAVTVTAQPLGGVRHWWKCSLCGRRCRVLIAIEPTTTIGCRLCLQARYAGDYPARDRRRRFVALVHALGRGEFDVDSDEELDVLLARRRRGVRRGRRVLLRAARALGRLQARYNAIPAILQNGEVL